MEWFNFEALSIYDLYAILKLRSTVFVLEQKCLYQDIDDVDLISKHLVYKEGNSLFGYLRLIPPYEERKWVSLGRIVLNPLMRKQGFGSTLIREGIDCSKKHYADYPLRISAQYPLKSYYEAHGFQAHGSPYDDAGIMHIDMELI